MLNLTCLQLKVLWEISKGPKCGYDLMSIDKNKKITQGTMYPLLQSMEKSKWVIKDDGKCGKTPCRCKKYYHITTEGKKILRTASKQLCEIYNEIFQGYVCTRCKK